MRQPTPRMARFLRIRRSRLRLSGLTGRKYPERLLYSAEASPSAAYLRIRQVAVSQATAATKLRSHLMPRQRILQSFWLGAGTLATTATGLQAHPPPILAAHHSTLVWSDSMDQAGTRTGPSHQEP